MEVNMSKIKSTKTANLLLVAGLVILSIMLAACGTSSEAAAAPVGLRAEAIDDLVAQDVAVDEVAEAPSEAVTSTITEQAPETETGSAIAAVTTTTTAGNGQARVADRSQNTIDPATVAEPTAEEIAGLVYMREEEKLARDVYLALYEVWGQPVFQNIASSEQAHMDSVLSLLEQYGVSDPAAGKGQGEFDNPVFQSLYEELVAQGSLSQIEASRVGATIEDLDIVDLQELLDDTSNEYIVQVYSNLLSGSENHLRAFVSNLERQGGGPYVPVYLDQDAYETIIAGASSSGNGNGGYGGGNGASGSTGGNGNGRRNGRNNNA
jgi:hypothetical protein